MGNNETIVKEYQNQSAVSNQAGCNALPPHDNLAADAAEAEGGPLASDPLVKAEGGPLASAPFG